MFQCHGCECVVDGISVRLVLQKSYSLRVSETAGLDGPAESVIETILSGRESSGNHGGKPSGNGGRKPLHILHPVEREKLDLF